MYTDNKLNNNQFNFRNKFMYRRVIVDYCDKVLSFQSSFFDNCPKIHYQPIKKFLKESKSKQKEENIRLI